MLLTVLQVRIWQKARKLRRFGRVRIILVWHSASETLLTESAEMLGKIHSVLKDYPKLPEGIGENFFKYMTPQNAIKSYRDCRYNVEDGQNIRKSKETISFRSEKELFTEYNKYVNILNREVFLIFLWLFFNANNKITSRGLTISEVSYKITL